MPQDTIPELGLAAGGIKRAHEPSAALLETAAYVTYGSITLPSWEGNRDDPVTYYFDEETGSGYNAIGLTNQGTDAFLEEDLPVICENHQKAFAKKRVSFAPQERGFLGTMCEKTEKSPYAREVDEYEVNAACPNHRTKDGALHEVLAHDRIALNNLMAEACDFPFPKAIKIAPDMEKSVLRLLPEMCVRYGFQTIVSANTRKVSTIVRGTQRLSKETGGQSGRALFRENVRQIKFLAPLCKDAGIKLISCGGIFSAEDLRMVLDAGADGAQLMTAWLEYRDNIFRDIHVAF